MKLTVKNSSAIAHLDTSAFYQTYQGEFPLKQGAINVLVGPNGSGKTSFLESLAFLNLTYFFGQSRVCKDYLDEKYWEQRLEAGQSHAWNREPVFAQGLQSDWPFMPALSYFPNRIPGREDSITAAMMTGYFREARDFARLTEEKSSGQANWSQLDEIFQALKDPQYTPQVLQLDALALCAHEEKELASRYDAKRTRAYRKSALKKRIDEAAPLATLVLLDEPEQSLDMVAQMTLWERLKALHTPNRTFVVATHSPLVLNQGFHLVETQRGYLEKLESLCSKGILMAA